MAEETERAYQKALYMLERRDYTETEIRQKLRMKEFQPDVIEQVVIRLKEYGLVNDRRFAEQYVRYHYTDYSRRVLSMKLLQKGIKEELFESVYNDLKTEFDMNPETEALQRALESALRKAERKGFSRIELPNEEQKRIIASLYRKGYSISQINYELKKTVELM